MPAANSTQSRDLAQRIQEDILGRGLGDGELFMTELQVAERFGTSRRVAREAVGQLCALGVLRARQRKGLEVAKPDPALLMEQTVYFYVQSAADFWELAHYRYTLEVGSVDLAIRNATEEHIAELETLAEKFAGLIRSQAPIEARYEVEYAFHRTILRATGSSLIESMHATLSDYFRNEGQFSPFRDRIDDPAANEMSVFQHRVIAAAFRQRDAEQARAMLRQHLISQLNTESGENRQ